MLRNPNFSVRGLSRVLYYRSPGLSVPPLNNYLIRYILMWHNAWLVERLPCGGGNNVAKLALLLPLKWLIAYGFITVSSNMPWL